MSLPPRTKYGGASRKLLLAFDIGTTFSGISYSVLDPGKVPEIQPVTRYPSLDHVGGGTKIPTVIYYDEDGKPCAIGAETLVEGIEANAEENNWSKAYWFKLHLRPKSKAAMADRDEIPPLPPNKTVVQVLTDYMKYLRQCAKIYISETRGNLFWKSLEDEVLYVLTHPNGWEGPQQATMRQAAIFADFIPDTAEGRSRISFVTEGEASLHFCLSNGLSIDRNGNDDSGVVIVDAGGGTIDVTTYRKLSDHSFEEIAIPKCYFQGAVYVTSRAKKHINGLLSGTRFRDDVETLATRFDRNTKHVFRKDDEPHRIQFASQREHAPALNIRAGQFTLHGRVIANFFEPSISCIIEAIKLQMRIAHFPIKSVFLVGGFSASNWLFEKVRNAIEPLGIDVFRPDSPVNKAVSNGAVSFFLDGVVRARVSRKSYGSFCDAPFDPNDPDHLPRLQHVLTNPVTGKPALSGYFAVILPKNTRVTESQEYRRSFRAYKANEDDFNYPRVNQVFSYKGERPNPKWLTDEPDEYVVECMVKADTSTVKPVQGASYTNGRLRIFYQVDFDIILLFGLTELKAQIAYMENGVEKRGLATVMYDNDDSA